MIHLPTPHVKARRYDATGRRERAAVRRERIVTTARQRFLTDGYAATTVASVAADAQVSVDTIFKTFGGKVGLLEAAWWHALEGQGERPAEERADSAAREGDADVMLATWAALSAEVGAETSGLFALIRALAVVDPAVSDLYDRIEQSRTERMTHNAQLLAGTGAMRRGLSTAQARDILLAVSGHFPEPLLGRAGWSRPDYVDLVNRLLRSALLDATPGPQPTAGGPLGAARARRRT